MKAQHFLALQERDALDGLRVTAERIGVDLYHGSLIPEAARRHPFLTVGGALIAGLALGKLSGLLGSGAGGAARGAKRGASALFGLLSGAGLKLLMRFL